MIGDIAEYLGWNQMFKEYKYIYFCVTQNMYTWFQKWEKNKIAK